MQYTWEIQLKKQEIQFTVSATNWSILKQTLVCAQYTVQDLVFSSTQRAQVSNHSGHLHKFTYLEQGEAKFRTDIDLPVSFQAGKYLKRAFYENSVNMT